MSDQVTICIPTYNGEDYLAACLESAVAQTHRHLEVLVVDDASSDSSVRIAERHARRDERIRVVRNDSNLGLVGNWNRCIALARGDWVKFLFQDDLLAPTCVERLVGHARATGCEFAACFRDFVYENGVDDDVRRSFERHRALVAQWIPGSRLSSDEFVAVALREFPRNVLGEPTVTLLSADLMRKAGPFNADLIQLCDAEYWVRAAQFTGVAIVREPLASFRVHAASMTSRNLLERDFSARVLDRLIIQHEFLFSPRFAPLRECECATRTLREMRDAFWELAYFAPQVAGRSESGGDEASATAWRSLADRYPRLRRIPLSQHLRRKARAAWRIGAERLGLGA